MVEVQTERVLVVPTKVFHRLGHFQGFLGGGPEVGRYLDELLSPEHTSYRPRSEMEDDPGFKQLIPYVIFQHTSSDGTASLFQYTRGRGQGEKRLHAKRSIGVGGHISSTDAGADLDPYEEGMRRELDEEVVVDTPYRADCVGLINDDETEVGRVHLGVVHLLTVESAAVRPREDDIVDAGFQPLADLLDQLDQFETWSQICLKSIFAPGGAKLTVKTKRRT
jgi:predicted NUDIX family phosphoesterase